MSKAKALASWAIILVTGIGSATYLTTRPTYYCAEYKNIADVVDVGDGNFKVTYSDGSIWHYDSFIDVERNQQQCIREELAN